MRYAYSLYFYFPIILLVVVKKFFGAKFIFSGEESWVGLW